MIASIIVALVIVFFMLFSRKQQQLKQREQQAKIDDISSHLNKELMHFCSQKFGIPMKEYHNDNLRK